MQISQNSRDQNNTYDENGEYVWNLSVYIYTASQGLCADAPLSGVRKKCLKKFQLELLMSVNKRW